MTADQVERLAVGVEELRDAILRLEQTVREDRERHEVEIRAAREVADSAAPRVEVEASARRNRKRVAALVVAIFVVAGVVADRAVEQHTTRNRFEKVYTGLIEGCVKTQASNGALRAKNEKLRDDTRALAKAFDRAPAEVQRELAPVISYLNAEAAAYGDYLKAIPAPINCQARYGSR